MSALSLPNHDDIANLFGMLLGTQVSAAGGKPLTPEEGVPAIVAAYRADDGVLEALCVLDLMLSCLTGAALSLIPSDVAHECAKEGDITGSMLSNLEEVLNVAKQWFDSSAKHVSLAEVEVCATTVPAGAEALLAAPATRLDVNITIENYGCGRMSLLTR